MSVKILKDSSPFKVSAVMAVIMGAGICSVASAAVLEEVVVTAQKRAQSIQDIGFSVSAFDEEDAARFANDIGALAGQAPGVESYGNNSYLQSFFIRGIGLNEFSGNYNPPVAVHKDEVYVAKNWATSRPTFDIERIEVLKGPQGTLFGRNTTGGAVNYYTKAPTSETEGYIRGSADEHSRFSVEGAVGGALTENVDGRLSFYRGFGSGGSQFNEFTGDDHGEPDVSEFRAQLQWNLSDDTTIRTLVYGGSDKSELQGYKSPGIFANLFGGEVPTNAGAFCPEILSGAAHTNPAACTKFLGVTGDDNIEREPNDIHTINQNAAPERDDDFTGGYVRVDHEFGNVTLTSLTSYDEYERLNQEDADGTPIASNDVLYFNDLELFSQELRLTGTAANDKLNYVAGLYYSNEELLQTDILDFSETPFNLLGAGLPPTIFGTFEQEVESVALYFNADYALSDKLTLTFGGRYTEDDTEIGAATGAALVDGTILALVDVVADTRTDEDTSFRLGLSYDVNDSSLLYVNLATAFRTGGYSVPFGGTVVEFEDEKVESLEVGYKSDLSDTVRVNAAAFFYKYDDRQVNVDDPVSPIAPITRNIDESEVSGLEADVTWLASDNVEVKFGYAYLDAEFTETNRVMTTISAVGPIALQGNSPVNAPEHQFNGSLKYANSINEKLNWSGYVDFRWVDERFLEVTNQPADTADSYTVVNASLGIQSSDGAWDASLWVKNLTDEEYITYINNLPGPGFALDIFGEQRTVGVSVGYKF